MINFKTHSYLYASQKPTFKGYTDTTTLQNAGLNKDTMCIHETYFFRNIETLNFATDYIIKNFKNGTNIADFASSTGEEAYSLAMILKDKNANKKLKITGYDITPRIINNMDTHLYEVTSNDTENFLTNKYCMKQDYQHNLKNLFDDNFEKIPPKWQLYDYSPRNVGKLQKKLTSSTSEEEKRELKYMLEFSKIPIQYKWNSYFYPKKENFKNIVNFKVRDISELGDTYNLEKNTGAIFFKNAFYHLLGYGAYKSSDAPDLKAADKVTKAINKSLEPNGILVIGALERDHLYNGHKTHTIKQEGEEIEVFDDSPFHKMLKKDGFKPLFYEQVMDANGNKIENGTYLPSIWQKVRDIYTE